MATSALDGLLKAARTYRDAGNMALAIRYYREAERQAPAAPEIKHSLAICYLAAGEPATAEGLARAAVTLRPSLWQSRALLAQMALQRGDIATGEAEWRAVLAESPGNGAALTGLAGLALNEYGDAAEARALVAPLRADPAHAVDATLTGLMATLYAGGADAGTLSRQLKDFARAHLTLPRKPARAPRAGRRRVGLISPLFSASPVYFLTWSSWEAVAAEHDLVIFDRGHRDDWATARLRGIAREWHSVARLDAATLADTIAAAEIDVLFDLGGWSDAAALAALSTKPAVRMFKWVGGQSATTGLDMFDGWIGDAWQSPPEAQPLYAEPLIQIAGGYIDYTPPDFLTPVAEAQRRGVALVGNPVKIVPETMAAWPGGVEAVTLIDRRYAHDRTRERVTELLARHKVRVDRVIIPEGQPDYLAQVAKHEAIVNTQPYAAGLTAVEALRLGLRLLTGGTPGALFAARHHLSHLRTGGRNPRLPAQILALIAW